MASLSHDLIYQGIKNGTIIKPTKCSIVGCVNDKIEAHHNDYDKPLEIQWLCKYHHSLIHTKEKQVEGYKGNNKGLSLQVRINSDLRDKFKKKCDDECINGSEWIRKQIEAFCNT